MRDVVDEIVKAIPDKELPVRDGPEDERAHRPYMWVAFGTAATSLVKSGYHQGTGVAGKVVYVGFQPDAVFVKRVGGAPDINAVLRTSSMSVNNTKSLDNAGVALAANLVQSLDPTGFTVGSDTGGFQGGAQRDRGRLLRRRQRR